MAFINLINQSHLRMAKRLQFNLQFLAAGQGCLAYLILNVVRVIGNPAARFCA